MIFSSNSLHVLNYTHFNIKLHKVLLLIQLNCPECWVSIVSVYLHVHLVNNTVNMIKFKWWVCPKVPDYFWKTFRACTIISKKYRSSIMVNSLSDWILRSTLNKQNNNIPVQLYQIQLQNYESAKFSIFIAIVENTFSHQGRG